LAQERAIRDSRALAAVDLQLASAGEEVLADALMSGALFRAKVRAGSVVGGLRAAIHYWLESDGEADVVALARQALDELGLTDACA